jgi:hypothetical protein
MSNASLLSLIASHPAQALNAVALCVSLAGAWLVLATQLRGWLTPILQTAPGLPARARVDRAFQWLGLGSQGLALLLCWSSSALL